MSKPNAQHIENIKTVTPYRKYIVERRKKARKARKRYRDRKTTLALYHNLQKNRGFIEIEIDGNAKEDISQSARGRRATKKAIRRSPYHWRK
uniref:hypothetical protein n=1 Tax=Thaumasiovibrio occultus TaxID=1891184 RepID=UPI000B364592|nr:hypothetical protein [Thaumasiovibrio occultus]